ncbi:MAG: hypothetical protein IPI31_16990 [Bacteroidetes bacterium]|jgi:hypothetical protein|nr:hypothetical protein [Bacteroidota bacterium]MBK7569520.1 hypothetical protein [Bacteroidota bacterium]MBP9794638.1 hypothetical protein [Chitinophagales bacterium]
MKSPSGELFQLIHSMSKPEKRYFTLQAERHFPGDNQYAKLFQLIESRAFYDEAELLKLFKPTISAAHFAVLKKQLYENVLEALHRYDEFADPEQKISKGIHYCNILLNKGLYDQCIKQIKKYKTLAYKYEKFENVIDLIEIEKRWITKTQFSSVTFKQLGVLSTELIFCADQLKTSNTYWLQSNTIYKLHYEKEIAKGKENKELYRLIGDEQFIDESKATTFKAKLDRLQIKALHAFVNGNVENAYELNSNFLQLIDKNIHLKSLFADRYFSALNNYLIDSLILQKFDALLKGIDVLRTLPGLPEFKHIQHLEANVFRLSYLLELNYFVSQELFKEALLCVEQVKKGLKKHGEKIPKPNIITLRYLSAYVMFCNGKFEDCISELLRLFKIKESEMIPDLYRDSRIMQLLCHFELGDYFLVESQIISLQRYLSAQKMKYQTYGAIIRFIKQYAQKIQKPKKTDLEIKLISFAQNENEKMVFNNINYLYWIRNISKTK